MNTASQDLPRHLHELRERMLHPTDYERALHYFLEEFAGDVGFVERSQPDDAPHLVAVLTRVASKAAGTAAEFDSVRVFFLAPFGFYHGTAVLSDRVVLFFYFQEADTGILTVIPGSGGAADVARFRVTEGLTNPRDN